MLHRRKNDEALQHFIKSPARLHEARNVIVNCLFMVIYYQHILCVLRERESRRIVEFNSETFYTGIVLAEAIKGLTSFVHACGCGKITSRTIFAPFQLESC